MTRSSARRGAAGAPAFLALAAVGFVASVPAHAADPVATKADEDRQSSNEQNQRREDIIVTGEAYQPHQESPKSTRPVRDTPQTVTVITAETVEQQNLLTLRDVLSTVPGITFGAGEGGGGYGDSINLRGYSANSDITVDGVRDSAQYTRTDSFNLEQIEVVNGANSVYGGSGSVGGSINIVTKRPLGQDRAVLTAGIGTDEYYRATADVNQRVGDNVAVRLNGMYHENRVPGRDVENYKRWGVAPSVTIGVDSPTRLTFQYLHQEDENIPQYGVPYYQTATNSGGLPGVDRSSYYGFRNIDKQETHVDQATVIFEHDVTDRLSIRNLSRFADVRQYSMVDPPQGTWCLASNVQPSGAACPATVPAGYYLPTGPRGTTRISRNQLMYDQVDLRAVVDTGGLEHTVVLGAALTWEKYNLSNGNSLRNANGTTPYTALPLINIANPNQVVNGPAGFTYGSNVYTFAFNYIESARQEGETENLAVYLFDTVKLGEHFELNGGVRWERNAGRFRADTISTATATLGAVTRGTTFRNSDDLFSYRIGLVYKPVEAVSLYAAYGNAKTPSKSSVNGSCTATTCNVSPEGAKTYEIGAKAEMFGGRLLLTAAAFRNERDSYRVASGDPTVPDEQLDGHSRVDGIALGAVGNITSRWQITANYTYLDGELVQSVSDNCLARPGTGSCTNSPAFPDPARGAELANTPKHSGSLFTTYALPFGVRLGYGVSYQGSFAFAVPTLATVTAGTRMFRSEDYWVHSAYVAYDITPNLSAQLNVKNITDEVYYTRIRNNGWATLGEARAAVFSLGYRF